ncbi:MAG: ATP-grasp domain-containing protein [Planctomycetota bacterium]
MTDINTKRPVVFVGEYLCGGGLRDVSLKSLPETLLAEGQSMWSTLVSDVAEFADVITPVDMRFDLKGIDPERSSAVTKVPIEAGGNLWQNWIDLASSCQHVLVVAPESDGVLARGVSMMRGAGIDVMVPGGESLRLASDKRLTARHLRTEGIASPVTIDDKWLRRSPMAAAMKFVIKPADGCGTTDVRVINDLREAIDLAEPGEIVQEFWNGRPASILIIASPPPAGSSSASVCLLPAVWQTVAGLPNPREPAMQTYPATLSYDGGQGPVDPESQRRIQTLALRVLESLPGSLAGFIGIDVVLGEDSNHDAVIEINPRLTTSYVGVRQMVGENLARRLFASSEDRVITTVAPGSIDWSASGRVRVRASVV